MGAKRGPTIINQWAHCRPFHALQSSAATTVSGCGVCLLPLPAFPKCQEDACLHSPSATIGMAS
eukprot:5713715-Amphidinium_carterae.1